MSSCSKLFWLKTFFNASARVQTAIMSMDMDLTNLKPLFEGVATGNITSLTVDTAGEDLYWYNHDIGKLEKCKVDGTGRMVSLFSL